MIYFCYFLFGLLGVRCLVAFINVLSFAYLPKYAPLEDGVKVSVLIPVRNEEHTIGNLLEHVASFDYSNLEILVYNDNSTDATSQIVADWCLNHPNMTLINGGLLPQGWLGKNYACHQLSLAAKGDVLLFLDADVQVKEQLVSRSVRYLTSQQLDLLSIFPKQLMTSLGEKISVPIMNWILLSLLPLFLIKKSRNKALSAANGQFMMFKASTYKEIWPHKVCRSNRVEDIAILKLFKEKKHSCNTLLGDSDISCRMYLGLGDAIEGFTKSIFTFFGNSIFVTVVFAILITIAPFLVYVTMGLGWFTIYVIGILSIRFFVSLASKQSVIQNLVLALPQHMVFLLIILKGLINKKQKKLIWKGRNILQE